MANDLNWADFTGFDAATICSKCAGSWNRAWLGRIEDIDFTSITETPTGEITNLGLIAGATLACIRPVGNSDNNTYSVEASRASEFAPLIFEGSIQGEWFDVNNDFARNLDRIKDCCLFLIIETGCCELIIEGIEKIGGQCGGSAYWDRSRQALKLSQDTFDLGTPDDGANRLVGFNWVRRCAERYLDQTSIDTTALDALKDDQGN